MERYIPYSERPEWADVVPIPQDDGPNPLVPIAYSQEYQDAMNYFRAIAKTDECSERALRLTTDIISMNPAHYTIWQYRQKILFTLNKDMDAELDLIESMVECNPKCYQLWHHRQVIVEKLGDASRELDFIEEALIQEPKNYHAWSYRQWVIRKFNLWDKELEFIEDLLLEDVRNNSAWNQRFFVVFEGPVEATPDVIKEEINYAMDKILLAPNNASPWNYIKGLLNKTTEFRDVVENFCKTQLETEPNKHALACLVEIYEEEAQRGSKERVQEAIEYCTQLASKHDKIRKAYWTYRKEQLETTAA
ncbi:uncharacterized protein VTP21DRAFT_9419 [Calcarisporiella thermophila]|uniref:uncharacterized protein n=1 Tax=Calcarisporiella thermophila TaxID=911321 RepID=UPI00374421E6